MEQVLVALLMVNHGVELRMVLLKAIQMFMAVVVIRFVRDSCVKANPGISYADIIITDGHIPLLQYSCTQNGVVVRVLGHSFQCSCEGEEVGFPKFLAVNNYALYVL